MKKLEVGSRKSEVISINRLPVSVTRFAASGFRLYTFNLSTLQPFNLSTFQPFNPSTFQPFNLSTFQPFNLSTLQPFNLSTFQPFNPSTFSLFLQSFKYRKDKCRRCKAANYKYQPKLPKLNSVPEQSTHKQQFISYRCGEKPSSLHKSLETRRGYFRNKR